MHNLVHNLIVLTCAFSFRIVGSLSLTHPSSNLDLNSQLLLVNDYETREINLQNSYVTSYDRQTKVFSWHSLLNKYTKDWNLDVSSLVYRLFKLWAKYTWNLRLQ